MNDQINFAMTCGFVGIGAMIIIWFMIAFMTKTRLYGGFGMVIAWFGFGAGIVTGWNVHPFLN